MAVESAIRKIRKIEAFKKWKLQSMDSNQDTIIHSTDYNQITMGIWTR